MPSSLGYNYFLGKLLVIRTLFKVVSRPTFTVYFKHNSAKLLHESFYMAPERSTGSSMDLFYQLSLPLSASCGLSRFFTPKYVPFDTSVAPFCAIRAMQGGVGITCGRGLRSTSRDRAV